MNIRLLVDYDVVGNGKKVSADTLIRVTTEKGKELIDAGVAVPTERIPLDVPQPPKKKKKKINPPLIEGAEEEK